MEKVVTLVLRRDGRHHITLEKCSIEDAQRWAEEGYEVFRLAVLGKQWAVNHVNSGKVVGDFIPQHEAESNPAKLLSHKEQQR